MRSASDRTAVCIARGPASGWQLTLGERLVVMLAPPLAFIAVTTIATALKGREWIVFYQTAAGALATTMIAGLVIGANLPRLADVVVIGIGTFLVFGRIGCFRVACCHGRPARRGVTYDERHVAIGLWSACAHRALLPVQLVEAVGSALLIGGALLTATESGRAACIFAVGYAMMRFILELLRGDPVRSCTLGVPRHLGGPVVVHRDRRCLCGRTARVVDHRRCYARRRGDLVDSNVLAGIKELMDGVRRNALQEPKRNGINLLRRRAKPPLPPLSGDPPARDMEALIGKGHDLRAANATLGESAPRPGLAREGFELTASRDSRQYNNVLDELAKAPVIGKTKGAADRAIVADTILAKGAGKPT